MTPRKLLLVAAGAAVTVVLLAASASADTNPLPFDGAVTDQACGTTDFTNIPDGISINVTVTAEVPTNDIQVNLRYGGHVVANTDTGVGQETLDYTVPSGASGTY